MLGSQDGSECMLVEVGASGSDPDPVPVAMTWMNSCWMNSAASHLLSGMVGLSAILDRLATSLSTDLTGLLWARSVSFTGM